MKKEVQKRFKGNIVPTFIREFCLTKRQAKKLICVISLCDGYGAIYHKKSRWRLETNPNNELHYLVHDLFLYSYGIKPILGFRKSKLLQYTEINGKICEKILRDLFKFTPTFKTSPVKQTPQQFLKQPQPTFEFLFEEPKWLQELALRLIMDLEGAIVPRFAIKRKFYKTHQYFQFQFETFLIITLVHPILLKQLQRLTSMLGFHFNIKKDSRRWSKLGGIVSYRKEDIFHFLQIGGFLTDIRISKSNKSGIYNNNSFFKQALLKASCEILRKHQVSRHFKTEADARKYEKKLKKIFSTYRNEFQKLVEKRIAGGGIPVGLTHI